MPRLLVTTAAVAAIAVATLALDGVAYATTGSSLVLGRLNTASSTTVIQGGTAPVLSLQSSSTSAVPLTVNGSGRVLNLNADRVDSLDSSQLQRRVSATCPEGQALVGIGASGAPQCRGVEPGSTLVTFAELGPFDEPHTFTAAALPSGRFLVTLAMDVVPALRGTASTPKPATCQVRIAGTLVASASAVDLGTPTAASLRATNIAESKGGPLTVACGVDRGTWSFANAEKPRVLLTPLPTVSLVSAS